MPCSPRVRLLPLRLLHEVGIENDRRRLDLLAVDDDLHGYEIKAERDTLGRLAEQARIFALACDRLTLVCAVCHLADALAILPPWWGIVVAVPVENALVFNGHRAALPNPSVDVRQQGLILWANELDAAVEASGHARGVRGKSSRRIVQRLAEVYAPDELRALIRQRLRDRVLGVWR